MQIPQRFRHLMWYAFTGTKGGAMRINIMKLLQDRPFNAHQLSKELKVDYRTILHHIKILVDNEFIECEGKKYGEVFFLTEMFESEIETFNEILNKLGKKNK